jgi:hypothetical protein
VNSGPRLSQGPTDVRPPDEHERAILELARRYVLEYPGSPENGEQPGHWRRKVGTPDSVRTSFLKVAGRAQLLDGWTDREVEVHPRGGEGVVGLTVWFRSGDRLRNFIKATHLEDSIWPGLLPSFAAILPGRQTRRRRWRDRRPATIARVLAIHYLSVEGGGTRILEDAARLYEEEMENAAERNRQAGRVVPGDWQALRDGWRTERSRVLAELREDFGAV